MRGPAYDIVWETLEAGGHSDAAFHRIAEADKSLTVSQKSFIKRLSYGTIERAVEADWILSQFSRARVDRMDAPVRTALRMAVYELFYMDQVPERATCYEAAELLKKKGAGRHVGFVNGVLRNILRHPEKRDEEADWARLSLPISLMEHLISQYGKKTARKIGEAFLERGGEITLHLQPDRVSRTDYMKLLREQGISCREGLYMGNACLARGVRDIAALPGYREGMFFVQDESSMLPGVCSGIRPGDRVIDVCGAPGGKSLHALELLRGDGRVSVRDVSEKKVHTIRENIERMRYENVECKVWDATREDAAYREWADVVLADVPCSGIGIIGRKPEIKYRALEQTETLVPLQRKICENAVRMLRPGGALIYSTCTIHRRENEEQAAWIQDHLGLRPESLDSFLPEVLKNRQSARGMLQMLPGIHGSDGFFVARFVKEG